MNSCTDDRGLLCRVSPFGYLRINGYLLLTAAFRSLSRPSSALSAKASTLRSFLLDRFPIQPSVAQSGCLLWFFVSLLLVCFKTLMMLPHHLPRMSYSGPSRVLLVRFISSYAVFKVLSLILSDHFSVRLYVLTDHPASFSFLLF